MKLIKQIYSGFLLALVALVGFTSCSMMSEEEPDCNPYYKARFRFDMNMLYTDAFASQVKEVDLYVFDQEGTLVWTGHEEGEILSQEGYMMDLPLAPGTYDMVAWCYKRRPEAAEFKPTRGDIVTDKSDLRMLMHRDRDQHTAYSSTDLHDLYHGQLTKIELPDKWGTHVVTVPLTKDTNSVRITLVHLSGKKISKDDFDFRITDQNGFLDHDNSILEDESIEYRPWVTKEGLASVAPPVVGDKAGAAEKGADTRAPITEIHSLIVEMTTSRLQTCRRPILTVTRKSDGEKVIEIPIIDYFMMVKGEHYSNMGDDEFLDRQDDYNMTFFMHEDGSWFKAVVDILSWRLVMQGTDI